MVWKGVGHNVIEGELDLFLLVCVVVFYVKSITAQVGGKHGILCNGRWPKDIYPHPLPHTWHLTVCLGGQGGELFWIKLFVYFSQCLCSCKSRGGCHCLKRLRVALKFLVCWSAAHSGLDGVASVFFTLVWAPDGWENLSCCVFLTVVGAENIQQAWNYQPCGALNSV